MVSGSARLGERYPFLFMHSWIFGDLGECDGADFIGYFCPQHALWALHVSTCSGLHSTVWKSKARFMCRGLQCSCRLDTA